MVLKVFHMSNDLKVFDLYGHTGGRSSSSHNGRGVLRRRTSVSFKNFLLFVDGK